MVYILLSILAACNSYAMSSAAAVLTNPVLSQPALTNQDSAAPELFIDYTVGLEDAKNHYVTVEMNAVATESETQLMMAVWTPGSYLVREYARHLDSLKIVDGNGEAVGFQKTRKNRWTVKTKPGQAFTVSYRIYCNEVSVRTNFVGHRYAVLNGAPTFLTISDQMDRPHRVRLTMPSGWQKSATSLTARDQAHAYVADDFDELVDSPIVAGLVDVYPFDVNGVPHQLVNVGQSDYWDGAKAAKDLKLIVQEQQKMWGTVPYDSYLFLNVITEGRGGLEHDNSCLMLVSRWAFRVEEKYQDWLSLASHEFFHTWNVRRLRPKPLMKYDYENEIYTDSLWIAEGITNYYEDVALARSHLIDRKEFLKRLSKKIETVQTSNGRHVQSLRDASFDTWIKYYRPDENSANTRVSYYSKGSVVAFLLDAKIRQVTDNAQSLDDVMREVWKQCREKGYTQTEFRSIASRIAGVDLDDWFVNAIDSTQELDYEEALRWYGVEFDSGDAEGDEKKEPDSTEGGKVEDSNNQESDEKDDEPKRWLGLKLVGETVKSVRSDSPATEAGINSGDKLIGINGFSIHQSLEEHLKQFEIGDTIELTIARTGELLKRSITIAAVPEDKWTLVIAKDSTEQQAMNQVLWLGGKQSAASPDGETKENDSK